MFIVVCVCLCLYVYFSRYRVNLAMVLTIKNSHLTHFLLFKREMHVFFDGTKLM